MRLKKLGADCFAQAALLEGLISALLMSTFIPTSRRVARSVELFVTQKCRISAAEFGGVIGARLVECEDEKTRMQLRYVELPGAR